MPLAADNSRLMQSFSHKAEVARAQLAKACSAAAQIVRTVGKPKRIARHSWGALATSVERDVAWPEDGKKKCGMAGNLNLSLCMYLRSEPVPSGCLEL